MLPERVKLGNHGDCIPFTLSLRQPSRFRSNVVAKVFKPVSGEISVESPVSIALRDDAITDAVV